MGYWGDQCSGIVDPESCLFEEFSVPRRGHVRSRIPVYVGKTMRVSCQAKERRAGRPLEAWEGASVMYGQLPRKGDWGTEAAAVEKARKRSMHEERVALQEKRGGSQGEGRKKKRHKTVAR